MTYFRKNMKTWLILVVVVLSNVQGWLFSSDNPILPSNVCYNSIGECYSNTPPYNNAPGFLPQSPEVQQVTFVLYTRGSVTGEQLSYSSDEDLRQSRFDSTKRTKVIIHGFGEWGDKSWVRAMRETILANDDVNVIVVDWQEGAKPPIYHQSVANTRLVGTLLDRLITRLRRVTGASFESFHLIGHSLGAHVAGYAGMNINKLGRITGLDPAGPQFEEFTAPVVLDLNDAIFVDIIHTNGKPLRNFGYGMQRNTGHVDFFPNGGREQPGCPSSYRGLILLLRGYTAVRNRTGTLEYLRVLCYQVIQPDTADTQQCLTFQDGVSSLACSHERGFAYFIASINGTTFRSYPCASHEAFEQRQCTECIGRCANMGYYADLTNPRGSYYLRTGSEWPNYPQNLSMGVLSVL